MQALSRREETEVIAIARDLAHKACDDVVKGQYCPLLTFQFIRMQHRIS